jgi:BarA-like signal transduction histidine kinase
MKKLLGGLVLLGFVLIAFPESNQVNAEVTQQDICCASEDSCQHPIYGRVFLSTLKAGSTCTVVDS